MAVLGVTAIEIVASGKDGRTLALLAAAALAIVSSIWLCAGVIALGLYVVRSLDGFRNLFWAAISATGPVVWFVPAFFLTAAPTVFHLLTASSLIAYSAWMLTSKGGVFASAVPPRVAVLTGTLLLQCALFALLVGNVKFGIACVFLGVALCSIAGRAYRPFWRTQLIRPPSVALHSLVTLVLASVLAATQFGYVLSGVQMRESDDDSPGMPAKLHEQARRFVQLSSATSRPGVVAKENVTLLASGVPGVILRPHAVAPHAVSRTFPREIRSTVFRPLSFPFSGDYYLFPSSLVDIAPDSTVRRGTPLEFNYQSLSGGSLETQAFQKLDPPMDFAAVRAVEVTLVSEEHTPASASLQFISKGETEDLGMQIFALQPTNQEETLTYVVPVRQRAPVNALRIVFRRNPSEQYVTTKVAVRRFVIFGR